MKKTTLNELKKLIENAFVVADGNVFALYRDIFPQNTVTIEPTESQKSLQAIEKICLELLNLGANRCDKLVVIGGGLTGDVGGFAASVYMRGIDWIFVPTTLLALVDASLGGKTAVNLDGRKNIIGAIKEPKTVYFCPEFLESLPPEQLLSAHGEIIKMGALDKKIFRLINENAATNALIDACRAFKKRVIRSDLHDKNRRHILNFGHTVGHAIELRGDLTHGRAIALGMRIEISIIGATQPRLADWIFQKTAPLVEGINLDFDPKTLTNAMLNDKKSLKNRIIFAVPTTLNRFKIESLTAEAVTKSLEKIKGEINNNLGERWL